MLSTTYHLVGEPETTIDLRKHKQFRYTGPLKTNMGLQGHNDGLEEEIQFGASPFSGEQHPRNLTN